MSKQAAPIYQIKILLLDSQPPIWRRLLISGDTTLTRLHQMIQMAMGWYDSRLHAFEIGDQRYSPPRPFDPGHLKEMGMKSTNRAKLNMLITQEGETFHYEYNFGDGWRHQLLVEKILPADPAQPLPFCVEGARACPPEDVGGIRGYDNFLVAIKDPNHPDHNEYLDLIEVEGDFDPEAFDLDGINEQLKDI